MAKRKTKGKVIAPLAKGPSRRMRTMPTHANQIRAWRLFRKIETQHELSALTKAHDPLGKGVPRVTITRLESGAYRYNQEQVEIIGRALGVAPRDLIGTNPFEAGDIFAIYAGLNSEDKARAKLILVPPKKPKK